jgi:LacI family transcriptional regulator
VSQTQFSSNNQPQRPIAIRKSTITDVADVAGVSIKTVSRVFNDEPNVRVATRERVREAAIRLDYHPNLAARSLAGRRSFLLGLAYDNPSSHYVVDLQTGVLDRLKDDRYRLLVLPFPNVPDASKSLYEVARASSLDGLILAPPLCDDPKILLELEQNGLPYARIGPAIDSASGLDVSIDDAAAARSVVDHLAELGHKRIAIIKGDAAHASSRTRLAGFREGLELNGLTAFPGYEVEGAYNFASGRSAARLLLNQDKPPTAIFASNDDMAAGVLVAAKELGIDVPRHLSVVGFDDSNIASIVWPGLTTIRQPVRAMAFEAASALVSCLKDSKATGNTRMVSYLVVRGSTASPDNA